MRLTINATLTKLAAKGAKEAASFPIVTTTFEAPMSAPEISDLARFLNERFSIELGTLVIEAVLKTVNLKASEDGDDPAVVFSIEAGMSADKIGQAARFINQEVGVRFRSTQASFDDLMPTGVDKATLEYKGKTADMANPQEFRDLVGQAVADAAGDRTEVVDERTGEIIRAGGR